MKKIIPREHTLAPKLKEKILEITKSLPRIEYSTRSNGEIDFYGASSIIANKLKLEKPLYGKASWKHGWLWYDTISPARLVESEDKQIHNLVFTKQDEAYLKSYGYTKAVAVGAPFIYSELKEIRRISNSILVFPPHSTQFCKFNAKSDKLPYVDLISSLKDKFSIIVASIGGEDVIKNKWIDAFEKENIPWITGAWSFDKNALNRINALLRQFEFVTSNNPGSHFAYASYCGCKVSFYGYDNERKKKDLISHPFYKKNPNIANIFSQIDWRTEFQKRYPFFFVEPWDATTNAEWAKSILGAENKKHPEEIARLFGWNIRQSNSGRWKPMDELDYLTNDELLAKATAKSIVGQHDEAFKLTNILKRRHVRLKDVEIIRARYFLSIKNTHGAREALKEELRHFSDNANAVKLLQELGGVALTPHVAKNEDEKEFVAFYNAVRPFTRLNIKRAKSLYDLAMWACQENIPGNFVECGVAAGGSTMLLALVVQKHSRIPRKVFAFDTFTGMPDPEDVDTAKGVPADETGWGAGTCAAPEAFVQAQCQRFGVGDIVQTHKGLFEDTLPTHRGEIGEIALLHMDADWYSSTMTILDNLFDQLHDNALIQIDDYGAWDGCKKAILDYSAQHDLFFDIHEIDGTGVWCAKPTQVKKKTATKYLSSQDTAFLEPQLSPEFADLYIVRKAIKDSIAQSIPFFNGTLLDVGCGQMPYKEYILNANPNVKKYIGLDFAQGKYADLKQPDITWDGKTIPLDDASVDCAMATEVLEHCYEPLTVFKEIKRVLKQDGVFFFTVPFLWPLHDTPHDYYRYTPFSLERLLTEAGFENIQIKPMGGWNASLAQMIGLWLKRAPMPDETRKQAMKDLLPFYKQLIETDIVADNYSKGPMITGVSGTARANEQVVKIYDRQDRTEEKNTIPERISKIKTTKNDPRLPNLFIIGAMKCGTSSLHRYLDLHPQISMSTNKEPHFFERLWFPDDNEKWNENLQWYMSLFDKKQIRGESSTGYTMYPDRPDIAKRIHSMTPDAKFIYIVRNPIERIISHFLHYSNKGYINHNSVERFLLSPNQNYPLFICHYAMQLQQYLKYFSYDQILVLNSDDLKFKRLKTIKKVFNFLEVDPSFSHDLFNQNFNVSKIKTSRPSLPDEIRQNILSILYNDIKKIETMTGLDLTSWCHDLEFSVLSELEPQIELAHEHLQKKEFSLAYSCFQEILRVYP